MVLTAQYIRPIFPKDGQMVFVDTVHFQWNSYLATSIYHLQIATDTDFTQLLVNVDVYRTDTVVRGFLPDNIYYWRLMPQGGTYGHILKFIYFTPRMIPNLVGWYAADSCHVTDTLMHIDTLYDKSGNNRHLSQLTIAKRPVLISIDSSINNSPSIYFDGQDDELRMNSTIRSSQPNTYCFLWKLTSPANANTRVAFSGEDLSYRNQFGYSSTLQTIEILARGNVVYGNAFSSINFDYTKFVAYFNTANSKVTKNDTNIFIGNVGTYAMQGLILGNLSVSGYNMQGNIPEFIYYNAYIDSNSHLYLSQYLSEKYHGRLNLGKDVATTSLCPMVLQPDKVYTSYLWSTGDTTASITVQQNGTYWLTTINRFGWQETDTIDVTFPIPIPSINDTLICYGDSVRWNFTQDYPYNFQWSNGQVGAFTSGTAGDYSVILTDNANCTNQQNFTIQIDSFSYNTFIVSVDSLCNGNDIELNYPTTIDSYDILWSTGDSNTLNTTFTQTGWYGVQVQNSIGCIGRDSIYVVKKGNAPLVSFTADNICRRDSTSFVNTSITDDGTTIVLSEWDFGDGQQLTPTSALQGLKHLYDTSGMYRVSLHCVSSSGCEQDFSQMVTVYSLPEPEFSPIMACKDASVSFQNYTRSEYRVNEYTWRFSEEDSSELIQPEYIFTDTGMHQVCLIAKNILGCFDSVIHTIYVKPNPQADFIYHHPCVGDVLYLNDITELPVEQKVINRHWSINGQTLESHANHAQMRIQQSGDYHVVLKLQYLNGCSSESEADIHVAPLPRADFYVNDVCQYDTLNIQDVSFIDSEGNNLTYLWDYAGKTYSEKKPMILADSAGIHILKLYVYDTNSCSDSAWKSFFVSSSPKADFSYDYATDGLYTLHFINHSLNANTYNWQFDVLGNSTEEHPDFDFHASGSYEVSLIVANESNCINEQKKTIVLPSYHLDAYLLDFQLSDKNGVLTPQILVLNKGNRALPLLQYAFSYDNLTFYETDSLPLPAGEMRFYTFRTSIVKNSTADYACVYLSTPYDYIISPMPEAEKREKCQILSQSNFVQPPYPNPVVDKFNICYGVAESSTIVWEVYDVYGKLLHKEQDNHNQQGVYQKNINIDSFAQGIYILKVMVGKDIYSYKISKR